MLNKGEKMLKKMRKSEIELLEMPKKLSVDEGAKK